MSNLLLNHQAVKKLTVCTELSQLLPPLQELEREGLESDILLNGCISPLITWGDVLVDGHHRYAICHEHGIPFQTKQIQFESMSDARKWAFEHQRDRRNVSSYVLAELALEFESQFADEAKSNQRLSQGSGKKGLLNSANLNGTIDTRMELAKLAGVSPDTIAKSKVIAQKASSEVKDKLRRGDATINSVFTDIRRREKEQEREAQRQTNRNDIEQTKSLDQAFDTNARFSTIVVDPPWYWGDEGDSDQLGRARPTYGTMSIQDLLELPVGNWADENCHMYLWITNRSLPKGFQLRERWGFRYIVALTWCKPSIGMGNYFRGSTEQILFGVKGSQPLKRKDVGTWFQAPRGPKGHSSKPTEFYSLVESCSPGPYLELFARSQRPDWSSWGADANGE